ncbi:hypothetical protein AAHH79_34040, partial [Burkholderia pseudomallei]
MLARTIGPPVDTQPGRALAPDRELADKGMNDEMQSVREGDQHAYLVERITRVHPFHFRAIGRAGIDELAL